MIVAAIILAAPSLLVFAVIVRWLAVNWLAASMTDDIEVDHGQCAECDPQSRWRSWDDEIDRDWQ